MHLAFRSSLQILLFLNLRFIQYCINHDFATVGKNRFTRRAMGLPLPLHPPLLPKSFAHLGDTTTMNYLGIHRSLAIPEKLITGYIITANL
jgi:hypothetical protein